MLYGPGRELVPRQRSKCKSRGFRYANLLGNAVFLGTNVSTESAASIIRVIYRDVGKILLVVKFYVIRKYGWNAGIAPYARYYM